MLFNQNFQQHLNECFSRFFQEQVDISHVESVPGGDISQTCILYTNKGKYFIKINAALFGLDFFEKEARGLVILADAGAIKVPRPLFDGKFHQQIYLVMEYLEKGPMADDFWENFGASIATLHRESRDSFGFDFDNYIGKIPQHNQPAPSWHQFYASQRIMPLVYKAEKNKLLNAGEMALAEKFCSRLADLVPEENPALLHGDLWKGNFTVHSTGLAAIFDPSACYGHRELDLAITRLFGGFDDTFYRAYEEQFPLQPGHLARVDIFQLYHLLAHLLLFGGHYHADVMGILRKYA